MSNDSTFDQDLKDLHLIYDYDAQNVDTGKPEKWKYEMWFFSKVSKMLKREEEKALVGDID